MSRYTDLMKKNNLTSREEDELYLLAIKEFGREERRLSKLAIDQQTRQECLWNVIDAHWDLLQRKYDQFRGFLDLDDVDTLENRMWREYTNLRAEKAYQQQNNALVNRQDHPEQEKDMTPVLLNDLDEKTRKLLDHPKADTIAQYKLDDAKSELAVKKCEYRYSLAGDTTITPEQKKALYQFHHWMRKHNATAKLKWSGFGYKGSAVDFSERFMRLPARVQLKALYLVETNNRKNPNEEIDNALSQDYVPNYDKLKKRMTSSFLFVRKYLNGSRYLWHKLEQAANIANEEHSVEMLNKYSDMKKTGNASASTFFMQNDNDFGFMQELKRQRQQAQNDYTNTELGKSVRKQRKQDFERYSDILVDYTTIVNGIREIADLKEQAGQDQMLHRENQARLEGVLKSIEKVRKNLRNDKGFLEEYQNYLNRQVGDVAAYAGVGTGLGTGIYNLITDATPHPYIGGAVSLATLPTSVLSCADALRTVLYEKGAGAKLNGLANLAASGAVAGSKLITAANFVTDVGAKATKIGLYLGTGAYGVGTVVNAVKSFRSGRQKKKASALRRSFETLKDSLDEKIKTLQQNEDNKEIVDELKAMKKRTLWKTLDHASKLIKKDKKRELNSNLRRLTASALSCISSTLGYFGNKVLSWVGIGGTTGGMITGTIADVCDNVASQDRNKDYIETEYPITDAQRITAIRNFQKQQENYPAGSKEYNEIDEILSSKEKLDNRIRNMQAGNHVRANQEGLRNAIYQQYSKTIADESAEAAPQDDDDLIIQEVREQENGLAEVPTDGKLLAAGYETRARELMSNYAEFLKLKQPVEKRTANKKNVEAEHEIRQENLQKQK